MSKQIFKTLLIMIFALTLTKAAIAEEGKRAIKSKAMPAFPELAKKMNVNGSVRVEVVVAPNGAVKSAKPLGGHPLLIDASVTAAKQFKYEPASAESTETITFNFSPAN